MGNERSNNWNNLGTNLRSHGTSNEHLVNMNAWFDLELRLSKNRTIDRDVQEKINREKKYWRNVLKRIIVVVKALAKNSLAFHGHNEKIYQENNENFLCLVEMIVGFDVRDCALQEM